MSLDERYLQEEADRNRRRAEELLSEEAKRREEDSRKTYEELDADHRRRVRDHEDDKLKKQNDPFWVNRGNIPRESTRPLTEEDVESFFEFLSMVNRGSLVLLLLVLGFLSGGDIRALSLANIWSLRVVITAAPVMVVLGFLHYAIIREHCGARVARIHMALLTIAVVLAAPEKGACLAFVTIPLLMLVKKESGEERRHLWINELRERTTVDPNHSEAQLEQGSGSKSSDGSLYLDRFVASWLLFFGAFFCGLGGILPGLAQNPFLQLRYGAALVPTDMNSQFLQSVPLFALSFLSLLAVYHLWEKSKSAPLFAGMFAWVWLCGVALIFEEGSAKVVMFPICRVGMVALAALALLSPEKKMEKFAKVIEPPEPIQYSTKAPRIVRCGLFFMLILEVVHEIFLSSP